MHYAELQIGSSIRYKILWLEIIFSNVIKSKESDILPLCFLVYQGFFVYLYIPSILYDTLSDV